MLNYHYKKNRTDVAFKIEIEIIEIQQTAANVGKSTAANLPAIKRHARFDRIIIIERVFRIFGEYFPNACQFEK